MKLELGKLIKNIYRDFIQCLFVLYIVIKKYQNIVDVHLRDVRDEKAANYFWL